MNYTEQFFHARRTSTPLVAITTADPGAAITSLVTSSLGACNRMAEGADPAAPAYLYLWDAQNGLVALNDVALTAIRVDTEDADLEALTVDNLPAALHIIRKLRPDSVVFALNAGRLLEDLRVLQGVWNLRDAFKQDHRTFVLVGPQVTLPVELQQDVVVLADSLPTDEELAGIVRARYSEAKLADPDPAVVDQAVGVLRGMAAFPAEQSAAMAMRRSGVDLAALADFKRSTFEQLAGVSVLRGGETYEDVRDLDAIVDFCQRLQAGPDSPQIIVQLEEFEKVMAGSGVEGGDNTGIAQDRAAVLLDAMEDNGWTGFINFGVSGAGKSLLIKAFANSSGALALKVDLGAMLDKHVGVSQQRIRALVQVLKAAGGSRVLFAASCNKLVTLTPELKRRFRLGVWFFDLPSPAGVEAMWQMMLPKYGLPSDAPRPDCTHWTGADVRNACDIARRLRATPQEAASFIVPVAKSDWGAVVQARQQADGRFLNAARGGVYVAPDRQPQQHTEPSAPRRGVRLGD